MCLSQTGLLFRADCADRGAELRYLRWSDAIHGEQVFFATRTLSRNGAQRLVGEDKEGRLAQLAGLFAPPCAQSFFERGGFGGEGNLRLWLLTLALPLARSVETRFRWCRA